MSDLLWFADLTTGPDGDRMSIGDRLAQIAERYGAGDVVTLAMCRARRSIEAAARRTEGRLARAGEGSVDPGLWILDGAALDAPADLGVDLQAVQLLSSDPGDLV